MSTRSLERNEIRDRFVELRQRLGWSVTEAAEELGVDQPTVSQWEGCKRPIPDKHLREIAARAGEPETYLMVESPLDARREIRDRLIAAEWMERTAEHLRSPPTPRPEAPGDLDELLETSAEARKQTEGDGPGTKRGSGSENDTK